MTNFFSFGKKLRPDDKDGYLFDPIPLFSSLSPSEQNLIEECSRLVSLKKNDIVYEEGAPPDAFYIIFSGRFRDRKSVV